MKIGRIAAMIAAVAADTITTATGLKFWRTGSKMPSTIWKMNMAMAGI
ncbi:MAG: hypothetical protein WKF92_04385 [Pyrinomonadaceae bacterium]